MGAFIPDLRVTARIFELSSGNFVFTNCSGGKTLHLARYDKQSLGWNIPYYLLRKIFFMVLSWSSLVSKVFCATCFIRNEHLSSDFEKQEHVYAWALYWLKTGWTFIFACHGLRQNNYLQNMNLVVEWSEACNHHPLKWTEHGINLPLIYLTSKVFYVLSEVVCNFLFHGPWC